jgi:predicted transcriptional regulator
MFTRLQYLEGKCNHRQYYAQFVTNAHKARVNNSIGKDRVVNTEDQKHFNSIPLHIWDRVSLPIPAESIELMKKANDYPTLAGAVCILKEAAKQISEAEHELRQQTLSQS